LLPKEVRGSLELTVPHAVVVRGTLTEAPASWATLLPPGHPPFLLADAEIAESQASREPFMAPIWIVAVPEDADVALERIRASLDVVYNDAKAVGDADAMSAAVGSLRLITEPVLHLADMDWDWDEAIDQEAYATSGELVARSGALRTNSDGDPVHDFPHLSARTEMKEGMQRWAFDDLAARQLGANRFLSLFCRAVDGSYWCSLPANLADEVAVEKAWSLIEVAPWDALKLVSRPMWRIMGRHKGSKLEQSAHAVSTAVVQARQVLVPRGKSSTTTITPVVFQSDQQTRRLRQRLWVEDLLPSGPALRLSGQLMGGVSPAWRERIEALFQKFRGHDAKLSPEDIWLFVAQARVDNLCEGLLGLLERVDMLDRQDFEQLLSAAWGAVAPNIRECAVCLTLGNPGDSTSLMNNYLSHLGLETTHMDLRTWLDAAAERPALLVDDCALSGTQGIRVIKELLGVYHKPNKYVAPLDAPRIEKLRRHPIRFLYATATDVAVERMKTELALLGLEVEIYRGRVEPLDKVFPDVNCRPLELFHHFCLTVGNAILERRASALGWSQERRFESALGFSNFQKLLVFHHNTPKSTMTLLWESGEVFGRPWRPLFPTRDN
jgi:hypothetical protein